MGHGFDVSARVSGCGKAYFRYGGQLASGATEVVQVLCPLSHITFHKGGPSERAECNVNMTMPNGRCVASIPFNRYVSHMFALLLCVSADLHHQPAYLQAHKLSIIHENTIILRIFIH